MTFLPIVNRELRVAARRRGTFVGRVMAAGVALLVAAWMFATYGVNASARPQMGALIFTSLTLFAFVYCLLVGTRVTADCLSEEKRDGTLGLLFLTDLKGYDVVVGKLVATSLNALYGLLAVFPIMAIPILLGGVSGVDQVRTAALLLNTMFFSLAAGMFASSVAQNERKALGLTILLLALVTAGPPLLGVWWMESHGYRNNRSEPPLWLLAPSPGMSFGFIKDSVEKFWLSLAATHGISWALLAAACYILPRSWQDKANTTKPKRVLNVTLGRPIDRVARRRALMESGPIVWLCLRRPTDATVLWGVLIIAAVVWVGCALRWPDDWLEEWVYVLTAILAHLTLKFWIASFAVRQIAEDRRSGALELVLATPLTHREIVRGHLRAARRLFAGPILFVLVADALFGWACLHNGAGARFEKENWQMFFLFFGSMGTLVADAWALGWLGLWFGLTVNRANRAFVAALWRVVFLPGIVMWFGGTCVLFGGALGGGEPESLLVVWFVLCFVNAGVWYAFAENRLMDQFRAAAAKRFDAPKPGWLKQLFGRGETQSTATAPE